MEGPLEREAAAATKEDEQAVDTEMHEMHEEAEKAGEIIEASADESTSPDDVVMLLLSLGATWTQACQMTAGVTERWCSGGRGVLYTVSCSGCHGHPAWLLSGFDYH
jgi:hypothetical protein